MPRFGGDKNSRFSQTLKKTLVCACMYRGLHVPTFKSVRVCTHMYSEALQFLGTVWTLQWVQSWMWCRGETCHSLSFPYFGHVSDSRPWLVIRIRYATIPKEGSRACPPHSLNKCGEKRNASLSAGNCLFGWTLVYIHTRTAGSPGWVNDLLLSC